MKFNSLVFYVLVLPAILLSNTVSAQKKKILVFSKTAGYHHESIAVGIPAIEKLGAENGFGVDATTDSTQFTPENLKKYAAVVFLSTTGNVLGEAEQKAFESYIEAGGGFVGVHAAADTEYGWPWYGKLVGAYFLKHPEQQMATLHIIDRKSIATKHLPESWTRKDEWYNYKDIVPDLKVLIELDESTYKGGLNGPHHPISWYHAYDGGRSFYTGLGHVDASYTDPMFLKHLLGGIQYAMGQKHME
ncbi:MAG TPA: ThuA domain-containing protein [Pedobacter sp.]|jgi:type 1 glutamine amidotransferase